ncbi:MAG: TIGR02099 family protein, partial [Comamonadaceae bacterium]
VAVHARADGTRVHRYLPLVIPDATRHYVRDAVTAGTATQVQFRVKGDLHHMPFNQPGQGEFRIAARVRGATYAYVPPSLQHGQQLPWPALTGLDGELIFERSSMSVKDASSSFVGAPQVRAQKVNVRIPNLAHTVVGVSGEVRGPLGDMLAMVRGSHIGELTSGALDKATATGPGALQLDLSLPVEHIDASKVRGTVTLAGNDVRITPETPLVERAQGAVQFTETGFTLAGVQGQSLGGEVRFEGGMHTTAGQAAARGESAVQVRAQGVATAQGLQQAKELGGLAQIARSATGSTPYAVTVGVRRGVPEVQVTTSLQGMALSVPAPLGKAADTTLPVRFENRLTNESATSAGPLHDEMVVDLGGVGSARYVRDVSGPQPRVLRGAIALGLVPEESAPLPAEGVAANVHLKHVDVDAWQAKLLEPGEAPPAAAALPAAAGADPTSPAAATPPSSPAAPISVASMPDYLPTLIAVRADTITRQGRTLHRVVAGGSREGTTWRANIDANELSGYFEYRQGAATGSDASQSQVFARLSRLTIPQAAVTQVDDMLLGDTAQPGALPSLDIVVQDFELRGRRLGRIEIEAQNRGAGGAREWLLSKFNLVAPEATFTSSGSWGRVVGAGTAEPVKRTVMNFRLDIRDSGELLARFGMEGVLRRGQGRMDGQVAWTGAPISPDYPSMTGLVHLDMAAGQFLKAEPGLAKLLSVLSLQSLPRRLTLDFRDVFSEGFAFDFVRGDVRIEQGVAITNNLQMKGVNAAVLMEGRADIDRETQDLHVVVVPEINAMTASLVATAINPVIGLGSFLAQVFLRGPLIQAATQQFHIDGTWDDPRIERITRRRPAGSRSDTSDALPLNSPSGDAS